MSGINAQSIAKSFYSLFVKALCFVHCTCEIIEKVLYMQMWKLTKYKTLLHMVKWNRYKHEQRNQSPLKVFCKICKKGSKAFLKWPTKLYSHTHQNICTLTVCLINDYKQRFINIKNLPSSWISIVKTWKKVKIPNETILSRISLIQTGSEHNENTDRPELITNFIFDQTVHSSIQ